MFPDMQPLILKVKVPYHCTKLEWKVEAVIGNEFESVDPKCLTKKIEGRYSILTIKQECIGNNTKLKVKVEFTNAMGKRVSKEKKYNKPVQGEEE